MLIFVGVTSAFAAYVLWSRRATWRYGWEIATTVNVLGLTLHTLLIAPRGDVWDAPLHELTGLWNADDLIGYVSYLVGITALMHTMVNRIDLSDRKRFLQTRLKLPAIVVAPILVGAFAFGDVDYPINDFFTEAVSLNRWFDLFWVALLGSSAWIIGHLVWALWIIRRESPQSTSVANIYLTALALDVLCLIAMFAHAFWGASGQPGWVLLCAASFMYLVGAWWSWQRKLRYFHARNHGFTVTMRKHPRPRQLHDDGRGHPVSDFA